jgi:hypothetical protein
VDQDVSCSDNFLAQAPVRIVGARVGGQFRRTGNSQFNSPGRTVLEAIDVDITEDLYLSDGIESRGGIDLTGCHIGGSLIINQGEFRQPGRRAALDLARAAIDQNMECRNGCTVDGQVLLAGAKIGGSLWCEGGRFNNINGVAINAAGLTVDRDVAFGRTPANGGFLAQGEVVLNDATINGSLLCSGGEFRNPGRIAMAAKGLNVTRDASFRTNFTTDGEIDLSAASIGGDLDCTGGRFNHPSMSISHCRCPLSRCGIAAVKSVSSFGLGAFAL